MRIGFMGTPAFAATALQALCDTHGLEVAAVYSQPPRPAKRGKKVQKTDVHRLADTLEIPVLTPINFKSPEDVATFRALDLDVAVVAAYGLLLPPDILSAPKHGCVNIHASLLPRWRGAAPIHRAIEAGDTETGICLMQMDRGLDTGDIIARQTIDIAAHHTTPTLHDALAQMGGNMIAQLLDQHRGGDWPRTPQSADGITYAAKIDKAEARLDWNAPSSVLERQIRAFVPFPGSFFELPDSGERIKILSAEVIMAPTNAAPGTVIAAPLTIACSDGFGLRVTKAQRAGKAAMDIKDMMRGLELPVGTVLE